MINTLSRFAAPLLALPRPVKRAIVLLLDVGLCVLSLWLAFYLGLGEWASLTGPMVWVIVVSVLLALPIFITSGLYRAIFRYSGLPAMMAVVRAMLLYAVLFAGIVMFWGMEGVPRRLGLI